MATNIQSFAGRVDIASNLEVGTANLFVDSVNNRVGIGKTNPGYTLDFPDINFTGDIFQDGVILNTSAWSQSGDDLSYANGNVTVDTTTFHVDTNSSRVGIGTTFPQKKLEVVGTIRIRDSSSEYYSELSSVTNKLKSSTPIKANGTILSFTGKHICVSEGHMEQGFVVSANKNKYVSLNGPLLTGNEAIKSSEALPVVSLSTVSNDKSVFGVVDHIENGGSIKRTQEIGGTVVTAPKEMGDNRVVVNSLGEGAIWVVNTNGNIESGDFLTTSNIMGYSQLQNESHRCNYTVGKATMNCNFNPKQLPIQIIKKDGDGNNILDDSGQLQWEDTEQTAPAYQLRYLTADGQITDESNSVYTAAYIGCTYHCG